jgi:hypothetical protein
MALWPTDTMSRLYLSMEDNQEQRRIGGICLRALNRSKRTQVAP